MMNKDILNFIKFAVDNNGVALASVMFDNRVTVRDSDTDMVSRLYKLFASDRGKFVDIMREAGYNPNTDNYTTEQNVLRSIANRLAEYKNNGQPTQDVARENITTDIAREWYNDILDIVVGGSQTDGSTTVTTTEPATGSQTTVIIVAILTIGGIGALIYFLLKR